MTGAPTAGGPGAAAPETAGADAAAPPAADDLAVLFPDVDVEVRDPDSGETVTVTVREFRFLEGLKAQAPARPLVEALADIVEDDAEIDGAAVSAAMAAHAGVWIELTGLACGRDPAWLGRLSDRDGDAVTDAMWSANRGFFIRRAIDAVTARRQAAASESR